MWAYFVRLRTLFTIMNTPMNKLTFIFVFKMYTINFYFYLFIKKLYSYFMLTNILRSYWGSPYAPVWFYKLVMHLNIILRLLLLQRNDNPDLSREAWKELFFDRLTQVFDESCPSHIILLMPFNIILSLLYISIVVNNDHTNYNNCSILFVYYLIIFLVHSMHSLPFKQKCA